MAIFEVGQLFETYVDSVGLSINQPSMVPLGVPPPGHRGLRFWEHTATASGYGAATPPVAPDAPGPSAACGTGRVASSGVVDAVAPTDLLQSCELPAFLACRVVCREWHGASEQTVRFFFFSVLQCGFGVVNVRCEDLVFKDMFI